MRLLQRYCHFYCYVDDGLFLGQTDKQLIGIIKEIQGKGMDVEDQGHPSDYVGVNIKHHKDGTYEFTQRGLTDAILNDVGLGMSYKTKPVPMQTTTYLHVHLNTKSFQDCDFTFEYRSAIGKLNYLAQTSRPDIIFAVHQLARYSSDPKEAHGTAIMYLCMYLNKTRNLGLMFKPDSSKGFECYADADFCGAWNKAFAEVDPSTSKSRSGWYVFYAGCPIIWASKLQIQTQVALSTTEAEYIALSSALRDVIPIMQLVEEVKKKGFQVICTAPFVYCKAFEDNSGALELARLPKLRPRTKHINVCYHHFREFVRAGKIKIFPVSTDLQVADIATKAVPQNILVRHRQHICGQ